MAFQILGRIIVGGADSTEELSPNHNWAFDLGSPGDILMPNDPLSDIEHMSTLSSEQLLILSPLLWAFVLSRNTWSESLFGICVVLLTMK